MLELVYAMKLPWKAQIMLCIPYLFSSSYSMRWNLLLQTEKNDPAPAPAHMKPVCGWETSRSCIYTAVITLKPRKIIEAYHDRRVILFTSNILLELERMNHKQNQKKKTMQPKQ